MTGAIPVGAALRTIVVEEADTTTIVEEIVGLAVVAVAVAVDIGQGHIMVVVEEEEEATVAHPLAIMTIVDKIDGEAVEAVVVVAAATG